MPPHQKKQIRLLTDIHPLSSIDSCTPSLTPRPVQFGCMLQRGYYPRADDRLRGTFMVALTQDPLPAILGADSSVEEVTCILVMGMRRTSNKRRALVLSAEVFITARSHRPRANLAKIFPWYVAGRNGYAHRYVVSIVDVRCAGMIVVLAEFLLLVPRECSCQLSRNFCCGFLVVFSEHSNFDASEAQQTMRKRSGEHTAINAESR